MRLRRGAVRLLWPALSEAVQSGLLPSAYRNFSTSSSLYKLNTVWSPYFLFSCSVPLRDSLQTKSHAHQHVPRPGSTLSRGFLIPSCVMETPLEPSQTNTAIAIRSDGRFCTSENIRNIRRSQAHDVKDPDPRQLTKPRNIIQIELQLRDELSRGRSMCARQNVHVSPIEPVIDNAQDVLLGDIPDRGPNLSAGRISRCVEGSLNRRPDLFSLSVQPLIGFTCHGMLQYPRGNFGDFAQASPSLAVLSSISLAYWSCRC